MTFPRFHLSTLLLLSIFCGALVGVYLAPPVWRVHYELKIPVNDTAVAPLLPRTLQARNFVSALAFDHAGTRVFLQERDTRRADRIALATAPLDGCK